MIGTIFKPSCVFVRHRSFVGWEGAQYFLDGYREAIGLVGVGLRILPIIVLGVWPFPGAGKGGLERRCLITRGDGSDNDAIYNSILRYHPSLAHLSEDVIMAFVPEKLIQRAPLEKMISIGQLSACFDIASWFVDTLPFMKSQGVYELTCRDVKALALGIFANILMTRLCLMGSVSVRALTQIRMSICGVVMEKMAHSAALRRGDEVVSLREITQQHMRIRPGVMTRFLQTLMCFSDEEFMQDMRDPDFVFQKMLVQSLRYFQHS